MGRTLFGTARTVKTMTGTTTITATTTTTTAPPTTRTITLFSPLLYDPVYLPSNDLDFATDVVAAIDNIKTNYVANMRNKVYNKIPTDMIATSLLYNKINDVQTAATNANLIKLLTITMDGLMGSMDANFLNSRAVSLTIDNKVLTKRVDDILAGKNEAEAMSGGSGQVGMTQTMTLSPTISTYILVYGLPAAGAGFDPVRMATIIRVMSERAAAEVAAAAEAAAAAAANV